MKSAKRYPNRVLVVVAHPDDEVIGCGGAIARHTARRDLVNVIIMGEGVTSRSPVSDPLQGKNELRRLFRATQKAKSILGVQSLSMHRLPDNRMDSVNLLDIIKIIEEDVHLFRPDIIYTHHAGDLNIDHRLTHEATIIACRPLPGTTVKRMLFFETASSTEWQPPGVAPVFVPNWYTNITDTISLKMKALKAYAMEMRAFPHPRSLQAIECLARWRGASVGVRAAEAFMLGRNLEQ